MGLSNAGQAAGQPAELAMDFPRRRSAGLARGGANLLSALTGWASGGLTIALEALGGPFMAMADAYAVNPSLLHRVAVIAAGTVDSLPHHGAVVTPLAVCGSTHKASYRDVVMVAVVGAIVALVAVIVLGTLFGSF